MTTPIPIIVLIGVIYLILLLSKRWAKMGEYDALEAGIAIIVCWSVIFGILMAYFPDSLKLIGISIDTLVFLVIGWACLGKELTLKKNKVIFWTLIIANSIGVIGSFYIGTITLSFIYVDGVPVVIFYNLLSFINYALGMCYIIFIIRLVRVRKRLRKENLNIL